MCEAVTLSTIAAYAAAAGGAASAYGAYTSGKAQQAVARNNAVQAEYAAKDAQRKGELEAQKINRDAAALKSRQRVSLAANGLDVGYGTAGDLQDQVDFFAQTDAETARYNAALTANSYRTQAGNFRGQADSMNPGLNAAGTLLSAGGQVADRWYTSKKGA